jgi:hypothetical protein
MLRSIPSTKSSKWFSFSNKWYPIGVFDDDFNRLDCTDKKMTMKITSGPKTFEIIQSSANNYIFYFSSIIAHSDEDDIHLTFSLPNCIPLSVSIKVVNGDEHTSLNLTAKLTTRRLRLKLPDTVQYFMELLMKGNEMELIGVTFVMSLPLSLLAAMKLDKETYAVRLLKFKNIATVTSVTKHCQPHHNCQTLFDKLRDMLLDFNMEHVEHCIGTLRTCFEQYFAICFLYPEEKVAFHSYVLNTSVFEFEPFYFLRFIVSLIRFGFWDGKRDIDVTIMQKVLHTALEMLDGLALDIFN